MIKVTQKPSHAYSLNMNKTKIFLFQTRILLTQIMPHGKYLEAHKDSHVIVSFQNLVTFLLWEVLQLEARLRQESNS